MVSHTETELIFTIFSGPRFSKLNNFFLKAYLKILA